MFCSRNLLTRRILTRFHHLSFSSGIEKTGKRGLDAALADIEKQFGKNTVMKLGTHKTQAVDVIPSGSLGLDFSLGVGGLPKGRIVEIYGPESSGKTTLALHTVAQCQRMGGVCVYVDAEHALDSSHAKSIGVNLDNLYVSQPDYGEQALEIVDTLIKSSDVGVVVVDSVAALTPKIELDGEMGDHHIALQARLMSQALRKITASVARTQTIVIFINQLRQKVGVVFGSNEVTTGGMALRYYASIRVEVRKIGQVKRDGIVVGTQIRAKVSKNKMAPPFRQSEFDILFGEGIDAVGEAIDLGVRFGLIRKTGAWFSCLRDDLMNEAVEKSSLIGMSHEEEEDDDDDDDDEKKDKKPNASDSFQPIVPLITTDESGWLRIGQGRDKSRIFLKENPKMLASLESSLRKIMKLQMVHDDKAGNHQEAEAKLLEVAPVIDASKTIKKKKF